MLVIGLLQFPSSHRNFYKAMDHALYQIKDEYTMLHSRSYFFYV